MTKCHQNLGFPSNFSANYYPLLADWRTEKTATAGALCHPGRHLGNTDGTDNRLFYRVLKATQEMNKVH